MMFGRRQGEILFRPVEEINLVLVGDRPDPVEKMVQRYFMGLDFGRDEGDLFKQMYMGDWESQPEEKPQPTYMGIKRAHDPINWPELPSVPAEAWKANERFYSNPISSWPIPRPPRTYYPPGLAVVK